MIFMTVFLAPVTEELIFRGVVFTSVREHSRVLAYVISALLFGFIHVMDSVLAGNLSEMVQMIPALLFIGFRTVYPLSRSDA